MSFDVFVWFDHRLGFPKTGFLQRIIGHIGYMGPYPSILRSFRSENTEEPSRTVGRHGWFVDRLDLKLTESVEFPEMIACMERVVDEWRKAALEHAAESGEEPQLLVVTKSLSTLSYPHSAKLGLRVVLLTPVLNPPPFDKHKSVIPAPTSST